MNFKEVHKVSPKIRHQLLNFRDTQQKEFVKNQFLSKFHKNFFYSKNLPQGLGHLVNSQRTKHVLEKNPIFSKNFIKQRFLVFFFKTIKSDLGRNFYIEEIINIYSSKEKNFFISFSDLISTDPLLALWILDEPEETLGICKKACLEIITDVFPNISFKLDNIMIKITEIPICDPIRNLRRKKIGCLVKTKGKVVYQTDIHPSFNLFRLVCLKCIQLQKIIFSASYNRKTIFSTCFNCKSSGPFQVSWYKVVHNSFQTIIIQEPSIELDLENISFTKEIILKNFLIDSVKVGQEIFVTGVLKSKYVSHTKALSLNPEFSTLIEANNIEHVRIKKRDFFFSRKEEEKIRILSKKGCLLLSLIFSFLPSILENERIKLTLLLGIIGINGRPEKSKGITNENINILMIGDPGVGKSQILKQIEKIVPDSFFLTAQESQKKIFANLKSVDPPNRIFFSEKTQENIGNRKILLIDDIQELDLNDFVIPKNKHKPLLNFFRGGGKTDLFPEKIGIIGTCKPAYDYYNSNLSLLDNSYFEENFLSNFDAFCLIRDRFDPLWDEFLGKKILDFHRENSSSGLKNFSKISKKNKDEFWKNYKFDPKNDILGKNLFKKFQIYVKCFPKPKLDSIDYELISVIYISFREEFHLKKGIMITSKNLESLFRIIGASARLHLREKATNEDLLIGLIVFFSSFLETQPRLIGKILRKKLEKIIYPLLKKFPKVFYFFQDTLEI